MSKVKVGLLVSLRGPTGVWAPSCIQSAILGAAEINAAGGIGGKELDLVVKDADWEPERTAAAATQLVEDDAVSAIVAMVGSNSRRLVSSRIAARCPFIYTPNFEPGAPEPNTINISSTDEEMIPPVLDWVFEKLGARRFVLIGCDYRWPLRSMPMAGAMIRARGGSVEGILVRPIDAEDEWDVEALEKIRDAKPDLLLVFMVGDQAISFHRNFHASGLGAKIQRCAIATDETVLTNLDPDSTEGLYAGAYYFAGARTHANVGFMERYWTAFGGLAPVPGFYGQSCYEGVQYAAGLIKAEKTANPLALVHAPHRRIAFNSARFDTPTADLTTRLPVYVAKANGNIFDVVARLR
ncbi:ABC transporter substrate-binding protein [Aminobacter sp. MSH1]|uniref:ABC transporter substrate-binding protein n=1 Tax=Aminobacter sp. MSH1 TaxID=374606 RepID=UPI001FE1BBD4|nr:ABC transporter substrate-binding protein [Aminobacter sp. MSH1]